MILLCHILGEDAQMLRFLTVSIVLDWTTAVIVDHVILLGHNPLHTEACGHGLVLSLLVYVEMLLDGQIAVCI